jgi:hypothetical protein
MLRKTDSSVARAHELRDCPAESIQQGVVEIEPDENETVRTTSWSPACRRLCFPRLARANATQQTLLDNEDRCVLAYQLTNDL